MNIIWFEPENKIMSFYKKTDTNIIELLQKITSNHNIQMIEIILRYSHYSLHLNNTIFLIYLSFLTMHPLTSCLT